MQLIIDQLLKFLDDPEKGDNHHAAAVNAVIGEDLCAAAFQYWQESLGNDVEVHLRTPTLGTKKGKRLDRWIRVTEKSGKVVLYQCEFKNWASHAIGGRRLAPDASSNDVEYETKRAWGRQVNDFLSNSRQPNEVTKVLLPMKIPEEWKGDAVMPLLIYWMPISNKPLNDNETFFSSLLTGSLGLPKSVSWGKFNELYIFSVSLYLRQLVKLGKSELDLEMPNVRRRVEVLRKIFSLH